MAWYDPQKRYDGRMYKRTQIWRRIRKTKARIRSNRPKTNASELHSKIFSGAPHLTIFAKCSSDALALGQYDPPVKSPDEISFLANLPIVITM